MASHLFYVFPYRVSLQPHSSHVIKLRNFLGGLTCQIWTHQKWSMTYKWTDELFQIIVKKGTTHITLITKLIGTIYHNRCLN